MPDPLSDEVRALSTGQLGQYAPELDTLVPGPPQPTPRSQLIGNALRSSGDALREYFMPWETARHADTPETRAAYDRALAQAHAAGGGPLPPVPGSPVFDPTTGMMLDLAGVVGPKAAGILGLSTKGAAAVKALGLGKALIGGGLHPSWISQRLPVGAKAFEDPLAEPLAINMAAMKATPKAASQAESLFEKTVNTTRDYPNMAGARANSTEQHAENFLSHMSDNLKWLYNQVPKEIRGRSKLWYEGANRMAQGAAKYFDVPLQSAAAVYAALSPRKEWFMNVSLGDRLMYIWKNHQNTPWADAMTAKAVGTPETQRAYAEALAQWQVAGGKASAEPEKPGIYFGEEFAPQMAQIAGKRYAELRDPDLKAMWVRIYDETYHDPRFSVITPEGNRLGASLRKDQQPKSIVWASRDAMAKAIQALESNGNRQVISDLMGEKHKVRNFYMNILDPHSPTLDVTIDTHAIAAALLRPLGLSNKEVKLGLGAGPGSDITGVRGAYGLYAEAYRRTAKELGISPRELQSIVWEAVRGLYPDVFKTEANQKAVDALWRSQAQGVTADAIRQQILKYAGGIKPPEWHGTPPGGTDPASWYATLP